MSADASDRDHSEDTRISPAARAVMSEAQAAAVDKALAQECAARHHLVVYLSGSHAYGFPSPDSDVDLKAVHIAPTSKLVGLHAGKLHRDRLEMIDDIEVDYTSNELGPVLRGILGGNGNYIERILGSLHVTTSPEHEALIPLVKASLARNAFGHYAGFATSQRKAVDSTETPRAKNVLYVLRTALTGTHLLESGEMVIDITELMDDRGFAAARELIAIKQSGERTELSESDAVRWRSELDRAMDGLIAARDRSSLPEKPENGDELNAWLIETRRAFW